MNASPWTIIHEAAPALVAAAPLFALLVAIAGAPPRVVWCIALLSMGAGAALALTVIVPLVPTVSAANAFSFGGWAFHRAGLLLAPVLTLSAAIIALASGAWAVGSRERSAMIFGAFGASAYGWIGAALAQDLTNVFMHLQVGWFSACVLAALHGARDRGAWVSALRMTFAGVLSAVVFALGAALFIAAHGDFAVAAAAPLSRTATLGCVLMAASLCMYAGAAPLQVWSASAFSRGGRLTGLLLATLAPVAALGVLARIMTAAHAGPGTALLVAVGVFGVASLVFGSVQAIGAKDVRRLLAYALSAQVGCALVGFATGGQTAIGAGLLQTVNIAIVSLCVLGGAAMIDGRAPLEAIDGLGRRAPLAGAAIAMGALGLIGAPLTFGFLVRWRLIEAALQSAMWWAAAMQVAASLAAVVYGGRVLERLYLRQSTSDLIARSPWRVALAPALLLAIGATIGFGLDATYVWRAAAFAGAAP